MLLIRVQDLIEFIHLFEGSEPSLTPAVVKFLVDAYARKADPKLQWSVLQFGPGRQRITGGYHIERSKFAGVYKPSDHLLLINMDSPGDLRKKVTDVLHEIQHYNQHTKWDSDAGFRQRFTKGKQLPPDVEDDPYLLDSISWIRISSFWDRRYRYHNAPHEIDARRFADKHVDEALDYINEYGLASQDETEK